MSVRTLTWREVRARRLRRHHLVGRAGPDQIVAAAQASCGIHAQLQGAAELALALRVDGITRDGIRAELWEHRRLVRMTSIRGTIHLLPAADAPVWQAAARAGADPRSEERRLAFIGVDAGQMAAMVAGIGEALDGRQLTLRELGVELARSVGDWVLEGQTSAFGGAWPHYRAAVARAAWAGLVCFGPDRGREVTYVRPDRWLGAWPSVEPEAALAQALRWYLHAFGPAAHEDFARWLAMMPGVARRTFQDLAGELEEVVLEGERRFDLAEAADEPGGDPACVRLLPHFDQYLLGSHPRRLLFQAWIARGLEVGGGGNVPALVVDGDVAGLWRRVQRGKRAEVTVESFTPLGRAQLRELAAEVERMERFTGVETTWGLGVVEARPHL